MFVSVSFLHIASKVEYANVAKVMMLDCVFLFLLLAANKLGVSIQQCIICFFMSHKQGWALLLIR